MYKTFLYADNKKYFRGFYKSLKTAIRYGQKDYNNYNKILFAFKKSDKQHKMVVEDLDGNEVYRFNYTYIF